MTPAAWLITWPTGHKTAVVCRDEPRYRGATVVPLYADMGLFNPSSETPAKQNTDTESASPDAHR